MAISDLANFSWEDISKQNDLLDVLVEIDKLVDILRGPQGDELLTRIEEDIAMNGDDYGRREVVKNLISDLKSIPRS
jgi:hypothetical protein